MLPVLDSTARRSLRQSALLGYALPLHDAAGVFGPPLLPLAPRHHLHLLVTANPCFCGGPRTLSAVLSYLWICSPGFRPFAPLRAALFKRRWIRAVSARTWPSLRRRPTPRVLAAIDAHASLMLMDRPPLPRVKRSEASATPAPRDGPHELASLELVCRRHLSYTAEEFWCTPYGHLNQLLSLVFQAKDPDIPRFDGARDRQVGARLRARRALNRPPGRI